MVLAAGWIYTGSMPKSIFPEVNFPRIVILVHSGRLPVEYMLTKVTKPIEAVAEGEPGVRLVRSATGNGISKLHVYFEPGVKPHIAYLMLESRLNQVSLPPGSKISVRLMSPNVYPFAEYALVSNRYDSSAMMPVFAFKIRPALLSVGGIYRIEGTGRGWPEERINLNPARLAQYHVNPGAVVKILKSYQGPFFAGLLNIFHEQYTVAVTPRPENISALSNIMIPAGNYGNPVFTRKNTAAGPEPLFIPLKELGSITEGPPPMMRGAAVKGYRHALLIDIMPDLHADTVSVASNVEKKIRYIESRLPQGMKIVRVYDTARLISSNLNDVWIALVIGGFIAIFVVYFFLRRIDGSLIALAVIPLSVALTVIVLHILGFSLNIMTLGGLTAAIGAMIDHAIVIVERGFHGPEKRAVDRIGNILPLMTAATITSSLVFVPLIFISGTLGLLFREMAFSIVIALITSQVVSLTVTPIFTVWMAGRKNGRKIVSKSNFAAGKTLNSRMRNLYGHILLKSMRSPWLALPVIFALIAAGIAVQHNLKTAFLPKWDEGYIAVPFRTPVGSSVRNTERVGRYLMRIAGKNKNVARISLVAGRSLDNPYSTPNKGDLMIVLKENRKDSTAKIMRNLFKKFRAAAPSLIDLHMSQIMVNRLGFLSGSHAPLEVLLFGKSSNSLRLYGKSLAKKLEKSGRFQYVNFKSPSAGPEIALKPSPFALSSGLAPEVISEKIERMLWGQQAGFIMNGEQIIPVRVNVGEKPCTLLDFEQGSLTLPGGVRTRVNYISGVRVKKAVPFVTHENMAPFAYIFIKPAKGEGLAVAAKDARAIIKSMKLPPSVTAVMGGYYGIQVKSFKQMAVILSFALLLIFVLLGFQFSSQRAAISSMIAIALSATGGMALLLIMGIELDSTAFLGILLVFAISVNNAVLIFSRSRQIGGTSMGPGSVFLAARERLRPILMTMLADTFGFLPLAIGIGRGTDLLKPLSIAVIGGLSVSIFMSLWLAPVIYSGLFPKKR